MLSIWFSLEFCPVVKSLSTFTIFPGGYLDFSHLTELKNINITEICMKKQYKSSMTKNIFFYGIPFKGYVAS